MKTPITVLNQILEAQLLQENRTLKQVAKKLLRIKIPDSGDKRLRQRFSAEGETLKSHPIDFSSSPMSEDTFGATTFSDTEGWYEHVVLGTTLLLGMIVFPWNETMASAPLEVVVVLDCVATYLCSLPD